MARVEPDRSEARILQIQLADIHHVIGTQFNAGTADTKSELGKSDPTHTLTDRESGVATLTLQIAAAREQLQKLRTLRGDKPSDYDLVLSKDQIAYQVHVEGRRDIYPDGCWVVWQNGHEYTICQTEAEISLVLARLRGEKTPFFCCQHFHVVRKLPKLSRSSV